MLDGGGEGKPRWERKIRTHISQHHWMLAFCTLAMVLRRKEIIERRSKLFTKRRQITISYLYFRNIDIINKKGICNRSMYYYQRNKYGVLYMWICLGISGILCYLACYYREVVCRHDIWVQILWHFACHSKKGYCVGNMQHVCDMSATNATKLVSRCMFVTARDLLWVDDPDPQEALADDQLDFSPALVPMDWNFFMRNAVHRPAAVSCLSASALPTPMFVPALWRVWFSAKVPNSAAIRVVMTPLSSSTTE